MRLNLSACLLLAVFCVLMHGLATSLNNNGHETVAAVILFLAASAALWGVLINLGGIKD